MKLDELSPAIGSRTKGRRLGRGIGSKLKRVCIAAAGRVLKTAQSHTVLELDEERTVTEEEYRHIVDEIHSQSETDTQEKKSGKRTSSTSN